MCSASFNPYCALRAAFPSDLDAGSAKLANFLQSLDLPLGAHVVLQVATSVEALMLYLAILRAGLVYWPLNMTGQSAEMASVIAEAGPAVVVCSASNFGWVSKLAFQAGSAWVFTLNDDRTGSLLERAVHAPDQHSATSDQADNQAKNDDQVPSSGLVAPELPCNALGELQINLLWAHFCTLQSR